MVSFFVPQGRRTNVAISNQYLRGGNRMPCKNIRPAIRFDEGRVTSQRNDPHQNNPVRSARMCGQGCHEGLSGPRPMSPTG